MVQFSLITANTRNSHHVNLIRLFSKTTVVKTAMMHSRAFHFVSPSLDWRGIFCFLYTGKKNAVSWFFFPRNFIKANQIKSMHDVWWESCSLTQHSPHMQVVCSYNNISSCFTKWDCCCCCSVVAWTLQSFYFCEMLRSRIASFEITVIRHWHSGNKSRELHTKIIGCELSFFFRSFLKC